MDGAGAAHAATFWGFTVLLLTIIESFGALFDRTFSLPWIGHWAVIGFLEDLFAVGGAGRHHHLHRHPAAELAGAEGRASRFFGSHTSTAWLVPG